MHLGDGVFILILALVLLGPKKTSDLANQLGKLMGEFRKASNDFKYQFNEEMRVSEQQEQQRKQDAERAALAAVAAPAGELTAGSLDGHATLPATENTILPPAASSADPAHTDAVPYAVSATTGEEHPVEDHPLLRVDVIPPMDGSPADQTSTTQVTPPETFPASEPVALTREEDTAPVHHG